MEARELTTKEEKAITKLKTAAKGWPQTISLFSFSGTLLVVDTQTNQVFQTIANIPSDGGDPGAVEVDEVTFLKPL